MDITAKKASNTLNFLRRNLKYCPKQVKQTVYFSIVRSVMEYSGATWDPHLQKDEDKLESHSACSKIRGKRLLPKQQRHCNSQELGLVILGTPSTKPTSDLNVYKSSASAEVADRNVTWYVL